eukprot:CAMPEP_0174892996 /NCGR_PEP_ID=MMETSP0167-20121228/7870_1 /TAXON_ID=38298 /ORGANISM="Rhodella maculata, Strain CCMP736" /LENGTH=122 /DNA_ID=CAMNT_0016131657 /DNA_START=206 /DNA_END=574 /DNA_ORIENTATION=-
MPPRKGRARNVLRVGDGSVTHFGMYSCYLLLVLIRGPGTPGPGALRVREKTTEPGPGAFPTPRHLPSRPKKNANTPRSARRFCKPRRETALQFLNLRSRLDKSSKGDRQGLQGDFKVTQQRR